MQKTYTVSLSFNVLLYTTLSINELHHSKVNLITIVRRCRVLNVKHMQRWFSGNWIAIMRIPKKETVPLFRLEMIHCFFYLNT